MRSKPTQRRSGQGSPYHTGVYYILLRGGHPKGGLADPYSTDPRYRVEINCLLFGEDVGHYCPTCDFTTVDVLCFGVHATDYIRLVHQFTYICPHAADNMQDGQA